MESEWLLDQMRSQTWKRQFFEVQQDGDNEEDYSDFIHKRWVQEKQKAEDQVP